MSGHSKWATIKRRKGANDVARGKVFTRIAREIQVAAKEGGPDLNANLRLRLAVDKARAENMPKDNIERAVRRGAGLEKDAAEIEDIVYEGYGPNGVAFLVACLSDNRNRTISEVRRCFSRAGGSLGEPGSVAWQFTSKGYIAVNLQDEDGVSRGLDAEEVFMAALDAGAEDVIVTAETVEVYTERAALALVTQGLEEAGYPADESELVMEANSPLSMDAQAGLTVLTLIENLEELDDVDKVYHNLELTDEMMALVA